MRITVARTSGELGEEAARLAAEALNSAVRKKGWARMALATSASLLETLPALVKQQVPWQQVEIFLVCERAGLEENDPGSIRRALKERFAKRIPAAKVHYLDGTEECVKTISREVRRAPIDVLLLGMGDQGQVGFNAAPADLETDAPYICIEPRNEGAKALVTMTVQEMMRASQVIVCAPYGIHAENVYEVITHRLTPELPATAFKLHRNIDLMLDTDSAAKISVELTARSNLTLEEYRIITGPDTSESAETEE